MFFICVIMRTGWPRLPPVKKVCSISKNYARRCLLLQIPLAFSTFLSPESAVRELCLKLHAFEGESFCLFPGRGIGFLTDIQNVMCGIARDTQQPCVCFTVYKMMKHVVEFNR